METPTGDRGSDFKDFTFDDDDRTPTSYNRRPTHRRKNKTNNQKGKGSLAVKNNVPMAHFWLLALFLMIPQASISLLFQASRRGHRTSFKLRAHGPKPPSFIASQTYHVPVMLTESCDNLMWKEDGLYVDCTLGGGGHTHEILRRGGRVIGIDQDPDAIREASLHLSSYIESGRLEVVTSNFRHLELIVAKSNLTEDGLVDGVLMDLGISSHQINEAERGFSFSIDGPLDMRMNKGETGGVRECSAEFILNNWEQDELADMLYQYGDEPRSRRFAREIVATRPLTSTMELEAIITRITYHKHRSKTLARCFQALRIAVNDEMNALEDALRGVQNVVRKEGRLVALSYHSLEDMRVKRLLKFGNLSDIVQSENIQKTGECPPWVPLHKRSQAPSEEEVDRNNRARSAKLRVGVRVESMEEALLLQKTAKNKFKPGTMGAKQLRKLASKLDQEDCAN